MKVVALVSGVASGIGKCIAEKLCDSGITVFGLDNSNVKTEKFSFYKCDVSNEKEVILCINEIIKQTNKIDYLINVAGIFCYKGRYKIEELPLEEWNRVFEANLRSVFLLSKYSIQLLKNSNNGNIINLSSEQVVLPQEKSVPYAVTKAAIEMFSKIMAMELLENKIRVNTIALASVRTDFLKSYVRDEKKIKEMMIKTDAKMPFGIIEPSDVYNLVNYLLSDANKITGQTILIDSGMVIAVNRKNKGENNEQKDDTRI